jgi:malonate transporter and related proteins
MLPSVFSSLATVFLLIALGSGLKRMKAFKPSHWEGLEQICYYVLFPVLIVETLAKADLSSVPFLKLTLVMAGGIVAMSLILIAARRPLQTMLAMSGPTFTSLFQGATRWNTFVALAIVGESYGKSGLSLAAVGVAVMIPLLNVINVWVLARYTSTTKASIKQTLKQLSANPFIWSCALGMAWNLAGIPLGGPLLVAFDSLGKAALSMLVVVGAGLDFKSLTRPNAAVLLSLPLKLVALPLIMVAIAWSLSLPASMLGVIIICASVQTASNAYLLAKQMGGDAPTMASIITLQTLASALTIPLMLNILGRF